MRLLKTSPMYLRNLPFRLRMAIVLLSFMLCTGLFTILLPFTHSSSSTILVIPIFLAAWFFGYRGAVLSVGANMLATIVVLTLHEGTLLWPRSIFLAFVTGITIGMLIGLLFGYLRRTIDVLD